jgi:UDP-N-acetylglucosamine--N-acetylmuramyl-(pentapeptide) pyrophosphoryl-undecaprenol N-acetylglucosamine transferase
MKLVIVGGHLAPALAVIEFLPKDTEIIFFGRKHALEGDKAYSLEYQKITALGIRFENLTTGRFQRKFTKHTLASLVKLPTGFFQSLTLLKKHNPDAVACFGGYLQVPIAYAAYFLKIPIITHEQTLKAGLANKTIAPIATKICISWPESAKYFPKDKTILTGLPLRKEFFLDNKNPPFIKGGQGGFQNASHTGKTIYITGGSTGAHAINVLIEGCLEKLLEKFSIIHQTGSAKEFKDFERLEKTKQKLPEILKQKYTLTKFIDPKDVAKTMAASEIVISRSGMNTIAELVCLSKPAILIPLPYGQHNEQLENALFLQKMGLAKVLAQEETTPEILYSQIISFTDKLDKRVDSAIGAQNLNHHHAAEKIIKTIKEAIQKKNKP